MSDCVLYAWEDAVKDLGCHPNSKIAMTIFYADRLLFGILPCQPTTHYVSLHVLDLLTKVLTPDLYIDAIRTKVYHKDECFLGKYFTGDYKHGIIDISNSIYLAINNRHAYYAPAPDAGDWIAMAVHIRRKL